MPVDGSAGIFFFMEDGMDWTFWVVTTVFAAMLGALAYFIKRTIATFESSLATITKNFDDRAQRLEKRIDDQEQRLEKRIDDQEVRHNQMIKDMPTVYAYREDMIRMSTDTNNRLEKIQDLLMELLRGGKSNA